METGPSNHPKTGLTVYLVCKSPLSGPAFIGIFLLVSLGCLPFVLFPEDCPIEFDPPFFPYMVLVIGLAGVGMGIWMTFYGYDRLELRDKELLLWRGDRLVRRHGVERLAEVRDDMRGIRILFTDRSSVRINKTWKQADQMVRTLRVLLDASRQGTGVIGAPVMRAVADRVPDAREVPIDRDASLPGVAAGFLMHSNKVTLPRDYLDFGEGCFRCSRPAQTRAHLHRSSLAGHLIGQQQPFQQKADVDLPVCKSCMTKRRVAQVLTFVGLLAAVILTIVIFASTEEQMTPIVGRDVWIGLMLAVFFTVLLGGGAYWRGFVDYRVLGVKVVKVSGKRGEVTLRFKDPLTAENVARRTLQTREKVIAGAKEFLAR